RRRGGVVGRCYQSGSREERECDRDERQLESRETDVTQVADPHEITIGQPPLTPERRVREDRRENDVREELRDAGVRREHARVQWRGPRAWNEQRERVRPEGDPEANEPRPRREVGERDRSDAEEARDRDHAETESRI